MMILDDHDADEVTARIRRAAMSYNFAMKKSE